METERGSLHSETWRSLVTLMKAGLVLAGVKGDKEMETI